MENLKTNTKVIISINTDDNELDEFLSEHGNEVIIQHVEDDYFWGKTTTGIEIPYHMEARDIIEIIGE